MGFSTLSIHNESLEKIKITDLQEQELFSSLQSSLVPSCLRNTFFGG